MTLLAGGRSLLWRGRGGLLLNALLFAGFAALATASITYLLAPRWAEAPARDWLADWQAVADATDRLIAGWRPAGK